jgi:hypothetical protein
MSLPLFYPNNVLFVILSLVDQELLTFPVITSGFREIHVVHSLVFCVYHEKRFEDTEEEI